MKTLASPAGYRDTGSIAIPSDAGILNKPDANGRVLINVEHGVLIWSEPTSDGARAVVKMYRNRSWIEPWRRRHLLRYRTQREYMALAHLVEHDIPCSTPLYWSYGHHPDHGHYEILATHEILSATPLVSHFSSPAHENMTMDLTPLFVHIRAMHKSAVCHGALLLRNFLVTSDPNGQPLFHIIDMARTNLFPYSIVGTRMAWYDLLTVTEHILRYRGNDYCTPLLRAYGLDEPTAAKLLLQAAKYRPSRETRNMLRGEFGLRAALARTSAALRRQNRLG